MTFNGQAPIALANELRFGGNTVVFSMTNRDFPKLGGDGGRIPRDTFLIRRVLSLSEDTLYETVEIKNFDSQAHELQVEQWVGGRFDDLFEVRGFPRPKRGRMLPSREFVDSGQTISVLQYEGLDGRVRKTYVQRLFKTEKIRVSPVLVGQFTRVTVPPKETVLLKTVVSFNEPSSCLFHGTHYGSLSVAEKMGLLRDSSHAQALLPLRIETDNEILNRSIRNAQTDIFMLLTREPENLLYPYAGIPWFSAPFGRDGIITAYQLLPWHPGLARGVLDYAFKTLGTGEDAFTDEQPGKVFHEMRRGEMALTREVPFIPYYGSVDSTPLCLILLEEYVRWTMDLEKLKAWWPDALKALEWIRHWGDPDHVGFLEYARQSPTGLINQGWKDSVDSVMHENGVLAVPPIRLCEVQAYAYRARMGMSSLARLLGDEDLSKKLRLEALQLRSKFVERFWDGERKFAYLALDGAMKPCRVVSSNMGHALWAQMMTPEQAGYIRDHLMSEQMFSGHGVRTLSKQEVAYNPLSYHNGSVWPHDNSLIMEGFRYYGFGADLERLALAMIGVLESSEDFRLPELFCGFRKRGTEPPVPYEVACKPQAWAAGSIFLMLKSMLGISMEPDQSYLIFNSPVLTPKISSLEIHGLRGRDWELDLRVRRSEGGGVVDILRRSGSVRVLTMK